MNEHERDAKEKKKVKGIAGESEAKGGPRPEAEEDAVEEASWESFPASDPPSSWAQKPPEKQ